MSFANITLNFSTEMVDLAPKVAKDVCDISNTNYAFFGGGFAAGIFFAIGLLVLYLLNKRWSDGE